MNVAAEEKKVRNLEAILRLLCWLYEELPQHPGDDEELAFRDAAAQAQAGLARLAAVMDIPLRPDEELRAKYESQRSVEERAALKSGGFDSPSDLIDDTH